MTTIDPAVQNGRKQRSGTMKKSEDNKGAGRDAGPLQVHMNHTPRSPSTTADFRHWDIIEVDGKPIILDRDGVPVGRDLVAGVRGACQANESIVNDPEFERLVFLALRRSRLRRCLERYPLMERWRLMRLPRDCGWTVDGLDRLLENVMLARVLKCLAEHSWPDDPVGVLIEELPFVCAGTGCRNFPMSEVNCALLLADNGWVTRQTWDWNYSAFVVNSAVIETALGELGNVEQHHVKGERA
jgi:hypothetical protein